MTTDLEAAAGTFVGHQDSNLAVDVRVRRIAKTQFELGSDDVAHLLPHVQPTAGCQNEVHAVGEGTAHHDHDALLKIFEVGADRRPSVDDEEHIAVTIIGETLGALGAVGAHRINPVGAEVALTVLQDALDLSDRSTHDVGLVTRSDPCDVCSAVEWCKRAAAEIEDEELHFAWCVRQ